LFGECSNQQFNRPRIQRFRFINSLLVLPIHFRRSGWIWVLAACFLVLPPSIMAQPSTSSQSMKSPDLPDSDIPSAKLPGVDNQTDPILAKVNVGVDPERPTRREESWVPLTVELENRKEAIKGRLIVRMKGGTVEYSVPINLPTKAKKSYDLTVFFPQMLDELEFYVNDGRTESQVQIVTVPTTYLETDRFIAVISPERGTHDHYARRPEEEGTETFRRVLYTNPAFLPRYAIGYQSLDVLLWDGGPTTVMSPDQDKALESWIQMGGTLILAAGEFWQDLNKSPFRLYTPMTLTGSRVLEAGTQLENPGESEKPTIKTSQVIATGEILNDPTIKVWLKAGDDPFLIERKWGAGRIVFIASSITSPVFDNSIHEFILKDFLTQSHLPLSGKVMSTLDDSITRFLRAIIQAELPGTWFIAIYLGCYILLVVPINYAVFRLAGRLEWAWFTVPVWAILFAYGAYYIGALRQQGQVAVNEISVVESRPSANAALSTTYCSIYSPVRNWYSIRFENPVAFPQLLQGNINQGRRQETLSEDKLEIQYTSEGSQIDNFIIYHWAQRSLKTQHATQIGKGVDIDLNWNNNRITGSITNRTGQNLYNPAIYLKSQHFTIQATLEDGAVCPIDQDLNATQPNNPQMQYNRMINQGIDPNNRKLDLFIQNELQETYANQFFTEYPSLGMVIFVARMDQSQLPFSINGKPASPKEGQTLLCEIFPLKEKIQGRLLLQNEAWSLSNPAVAAGGRSQMYNASLPMPGMGIYGGMSNMGPMRITELPGQPPDSQIKWDVNSNVSLAGCKVESFSLDVNYERMGFLNQRNVAGQAEKFELVKGKPADPEYELQLEDIYDRTFRPLSQIRNENGEITNPGRYVDKVSGIISARIKSPPEQSVRIALDAMQIRLTINFGTEAGGKFLGYFIDAATEDKSNANAQKAESTDNQETKSDL
jgi:hypothetical protein